MGHSEIRASLTYILGLRTYRAKKKSCIKNPKKEEGEEGEKKKEDEEMVVEEVVVVMAVGEFSVSWCSLEISEKLHPNKTGTMRILMYIVT